MNPRENLLNLYHRKGAKTAPVGFVLCESLEKEFKNRYPEAKSYQDYFDFPYRKIIDPGFTWPSPGETEEKFSKRLKISNIPDKPVNREVY